MKPATNRFALLAMVLLVAAVAAYWYWSPYLTMRAVTRDLQTEGPAKLDAYVDYPKVRENVKKQFRKMLVDRGSRGGEEFQLVSGAVNDMVRPESLPEKMARGRLFNPMARVGYFPDHEGELTWVIEREGLNRFIARDARVKDQEPAPGYVFDRYGLTNWILTDIRFEEPD